MIKLSSDKYKHRYYYKESYEAAIGTFATAIVFLFVAILSLFFRGFQQLYRKYKYQQVVKNAIIQRNFEGTHKLEHIALEIGMRPKDILRVLVDLRAKGIVQYSFSSETGEIVLGKAIIYTPANEYVPPAKKLETPLPTEGKNFCVYCGHKIEASGKYCPNCGSNL